MCPSADGFAPSSCGGCCAATAPAAFIPRAGIEQLCPDDRDPSLDEVVVIAAHYGTSALMALYRFGQCRLASEACVTALASAIDARDHDAAFKRLGCVRRDDRLATLDALPYLSAPLRHGRLGAVLRGDAEAEPALATAITRLLG